ncbi:hypothetical protein D9757_012612 [Collybiopsis confluens]|uniref:Uncharacterized protein n=1 Tax=Collybiopsis confluens TaxID=2823264 RepID=A0A8H5GHL3_9AGAR|nr:hypothetical protein D9757_012612 [Collybiopsis confluens]
MIRSPSRVPSRPQILNSRKAHPKALHDSAQSSDKVTQETTSQLASQDRRISRSSVFGQTSTSNDASNSDAGRSVALTEIEELQLSSYDTTSSNFSFSRP